MIRRATPEDLDQLVELENLGFATDRFNRNQFRYLISKGRGALLVEEEDGRIVGMLILLWRQRSRACRVYSVVVHPEVQGKGLGRRLMEEAERVARANGLKRIILQVRIGNPTAIHLYESLGYVRGGLLPGYYEGGEAGILYQKELRDSPTQTF